MLSISNIVNVQLNAVPKSALRRDFGRVALFTPETGEAFKDVKTRYVYVNSQQDVEQLFGTNSETAKAAQPFFMQRPRAKQLIIVRWNKTRQTITATANSLIGATLSTPLDDFKLIQNGAFSLSVGDEIKTVGELDFSSATTLEGVAKIVETKLKTINEKLTVQIDTAANRMLIATTEVGNDPKTVLGFAFHGKEVGTYIGSLLKWEDGQAVKQIGTQAATVNAETVAQALFQVSEVNSTWYGFIFADQLTDTQFETAAKWAQANEKLFGASLIRAEQLEWEPSNIFKKLYDAKLDHVLPVFDKNDMYPSSSALARLLSMNFAANNSTLTLKFKQQPGITADDITLTEYKKAQRLGVNVYTYFDDVAMITDGTVLGGKFADEIVILDWFKDAVQKEVFNRLYKSPTKIPLTDKGQAILMSAVEKVCLEGINNGAFAPGKWTGDSFGSLVTDDYLEKGFYVYAAPMDTLSDSDREIRKATPIQVAVKLAGAIHSSDIIINFNR